jgi:prefoldin subunit 5
MEQEQKIQQLENALLASREDIQALQKKVATLEVKIRELETNLNNLGSSFAARP